MTTLNMTVHHRVSTQSLLTGLGYLAGRIFSHGRFNLDSNVGILTRKRSEEQAGKQQKPYIRQKQGSHKGQTIIFLLWPWTFWTQSLNYSKMQGLTVRCRFYWFNFINRFNTYIQWNRWKTAALRLYALPVALKHSSNSASLIFIIFNSMHWPQGWHDPAI